MYILRYLNEIKEKAMEISMGRAFQAKGTVSTKALGQDCALRTLRFSMAEAE